MSNRYRIRNKKKVRDENKIKRICLKCNEPFMAEGKFNRICPECTKVNEWECQNAYEVYYTGVRI